MHRYLFYLFALITFFLLSTALAASQWQYGILIFSSMQMQWRSADGLTRSSVNFDDFWNQLTGNEPQSQVLQDAGPEVSLLEYLGGQGWELVTISFEPQQRVYYFKRELTSE